MEGFIASDLFHWFIFPTIIFIARIMDVSLGTIRIIMISKGKKELAMLIGFLEISLWLLISAKVIQSLDNVLYLFAYSGGFAAGSYTGLLLDEKLAIGQISVRLILNCPPQKFIEVLKERGYGVTFFEASGARGKAYVIYSIMNRKKFDEFEKMAKEYHPKAFISIENTKTVKEGIFHPHQSIFDIRKMAPSRKIK